MDELKDELYQELTDAGYNTHDISALLRVLTKRSETEEVTLARIWDLGSLFANFQEEKSLMS